MINYPISHSDLKNQIKVEKPDWIERAKERTEEFRANGFYNETSSIWSEVKPVYMRLQGDCKCAYCERKLESLDYGKAEQDVEHFRPKNKVRAWNPPESITDKGIDLCTVPNEDRGYFLLPYHIFNYSASCKPCNSALKKNCFPIASSYNLAGKSPRQLLKEKPYLIYPIGNYDDNPEDLIQFHGTSPQAVVAKGHKRSRALVTIEFFKLDDVNKRKNLFRDRSMVIIAMYPQLRKMNRSPDTPESAEARRLVRGFTSPKAIHTNCARSYQKLFETNPLEADAIFNRAADFICSIS